MTATEPKMDIDELVHHLQRLYGLSEPDARLIMSDPESADMAREFVEGKLARDAAQRESARRLGEAVAHRPLRGIYLQITW